jgi:glycosyltransferase involved in cell wall biosynthesis/peptidoglycan/xylan/chitin deacetylase (PgdA/CDA1 family)
VVKGIDPAPGHLPEFQVICVCGGYGYPLGNASAARITMVGRALQAAGFGFSLLHCGPSPMTINTEPSGVYEGIHFEYTTPVRRPENPLARILMYIRGAVGLTVRLARLWPVRRSRLVYLYVMDGPLGLYIGLLCGLLGLPVVQELCEWFPGVPGCSRFTKWFYSKPIFKLATGVLVISRFIERCVTARQAAVNPQLSIHRLPAVVDAERFSNSGTILDPVPDPIPTFVYCGTWLIDISFLIDAFALVRDSGYSCKLKLVGGSLEEYGKTILDLAADCGLASEDIIFTGCVDAHTLEACYRNASALLMPLWADDRSIARIPNKMPEYLASGRPVVAGNIGDLTEILTDGVNAYLAEAGNTREFANRMIAVLDDPSRASQIGAAGRESCVAHLDYRAHVEGLAQFFGSCFDRRNRRRPVSNESGSLPRIVRVARNGICELIALALILIGSVRRARHTALNGNVITAIYFHKPEKLLFGRCIDWLTRYGYTFISADDVTDCLYRGKVPPVGAVWISFDDGCRELLTNVLPVVRERNIPITLFIPSGIVGGEGQFPWMDGKRVNCPRDAITLEQLKDLATYPQVTIAGHTVSHAITAGLAEEKTWIELSECKRSLNLWTAAEIKYFAYPAGQTDGREQDMLAVLGYRMAATTENAFVTSTSNPYQVPRFSVADEISFPEAICNMVGVWRPVIDPIIQFVGRWRRAASTRNSSLSDVEPQSAVSSGARVSQ